MSAYESNRCRITPAAEPKRFDTYFYLAALRGAPPELNADSSEITNAIWFAHRLSSAALLTACFNATRFTPQEALEAGKKKTIMLAPPTMFVLSVRPYAAAGHQRAALLLQELAALRTIEDVFRE